MRFFIFISIALGSMSATAQSLREFDLQNRYEQTHQARFPSDEQPLRFFTPSDSPITTRGDGNNFTGNLNYISGDAFLARNRTRERVQATYTTISGEIATRDFYFCEGITLVSKGDIMSIPRDSLLTLSYTNDDCLVYANFNFEYTEMALGTFPNIILTIPDGSRIRMPMCSTNGATGWQTQEESPDQLYLSTLNCQNGQVTRTNQTQVMAVEMSSRLCASYRPSAPTQAVNNCEVPLPQAEPASTP